MKFMNLVTLLELINKLGPKFKEALPHLIALYKIISEALQSPAGPVSYGIPSAPSSAYLQVVNAGRANGASDEEIYELANMVNSHSVE